MKGFFLVCSVVIIVLLGWRVKLLEKKYNDMILKGIFCKKDIWEE